MVCQACGNAVSGEVHFCPRCGAPIAGAAPPQEYVPPPSQGYVPTPAQSYPPPQYPYPPVMTPVPRVQRNLQTLAILWCCYGVYRLVFGLIGMFFLRSSMWRHWVPGRELPWGVGPFGSSFMAGLVPVIGVITIVSFGLALLTGYALLTRRPWGRTLAIIAAVLALFRIPLGTLLGIYTLWVLVPSASGFEYDAIADRT